MGYDVRARQARCAALGFWPGPLDGVDGKRTQAAYQQAVTAQKDKGLPFQHPSGLTRVHIHWTGGANTASSLDFQHYHVVIDGAGKVHRPNPVTAKLAHTLNANGGAIGVSLCGMAGAVERPFSRGSFPITPLQLGVMAQTVAELCRDYDIPVSRYSVLTHAEIQPTLGITQRGKWDICWLPGMPATGAPVEVGDRLREMIASAKAGLL